MTKLQFTSLFFLCLFLQLPEAWSQDSADFEVPFSGPGLATPFQWQDEWGSIHMNTYTDGLEDPGTNVVPDGTRMPCGRGKICNEYFPDRPKTPTTIANGIKYDIKNSVLYCASKPSPNYPAANADFGNQFSWNVSWRILSAKIGEDGPTVSTDPRYPGGKGSKTEDPNVDGGWKTMLYHPLWDARANDLRTTPTGCMQQVSNDIVQDIHTCLDNPAYNACSRDENACNDEVVFNGSKNFIKGPGHLNPVSHVFTKAEIAQLGGPGKMPSIYYAYRKATEFDETLSNQTSPPEGKDYVLVGAGEDTESGETTKNYKIVKKYETVLSKTLTINDANKVRNENNDREDKVYLKTVHNKDSALDRIGTYRIGLTTSTYFNPNIEGFIVVDPSEFFDLRLYVDKKECSTNGTKQNNKVPNEDGQCGKFATGYPQMTNRKGVREVDTFDTCPILGLNIGYSGICDPTGNAGCNLPIYGIGPTSEITTIDETIATAAGTETKPYSYTPYSIIWSGYVRSWKFISVQQYLANTRGRKGINGGSLYAEEIDLNVSPILMVERADDYCDIREKFRNKVKTPDDPTFDAATDIIPCIQYKQYQKVDVGEYLFVDLFMPNADPGVSTWYATQELRTFDTVNYSLTGALDGNGIPDIANEVAGDCDGRFVGLGVISLENRPESYNICHKISNPAYADAVDKTSIPEFLGYGSFLSAVPPTFRERRMRDGEQVAISRPMPAIKDLPIKMRVLRELEEGDERNIDDDPNNDVVDYVTVDNNLNISRSDLDTEDPPIKAGEKHGEGFGIQFKPGRTIAARVLPAFMMREDDDLEDPRILSGTVSVTGVDVVGDGTQFERELKQGQKIIINKIPIKIESIISNTELKLVKPHVDTAVGVVALRDDILTRCALFSTKASPDPSAAVQPPDMFVPSNTERELKAFLNSGIDAVTIKPCAAQFMDVAQYRAKTNENTNNNGTKTWIGTTSCEQLAEKPACNQTKIITAQRYCILEDGKQGTCGECEEEAARAKALARQISFEKGEEFKINLDPDDLSFVTAFATSAGSQLLADPRVSGNSCFFSAACFNINSAGCPPAGTTGGHVFCFAPETKITMADGSQKSIIDVKPGDMVKAFMGSDSKKKLQTARVKGTAKTKDQHIMKLVTTYKDKNGKTQTQSIRMTPNHKVILSTGRAVEANALRPGIEILGTNGSRVMVQEIINEKSKINVYNLILDDGYEGYIANGLRVLSYPYFSELTASN